MLFYCSHTKSPYPTTFLPTFPQTSPGKTQNHSYSTPSLPVESPQVCEIYLEISQSPKVKSLIV